MESIVRCPTGIEWFDEITGGGLVRGTLTLLAGNPRTGKTSFVAKFLFKGAKDYGEPGIYVSFAETKGKFYVYMAQQGLNFKEIENGGLFKFLGASTVLDRDVLGHFLAEILEVVEKLEAKRLVIDSITPILQLASSLEVRSILHNALSNLANVKNLTIILVADLPFGESKVGYGVEEFIVNSVILLRLQYEPYRSLRRTMEIVKMRGTPILNAVYEYSIVPKVGFIVFVPLKTSEACVRPDVKISTGVKGLDEMLGGGLSKGSSTLIIGSSGSGKTVLALTIAAEAAFKGLNIVYINFEELKSHLEHSLRGLGYSYEELESRSLKVVPHLPHVMPSGALRYHLHQVHVMRGFDKDLAIIDGLAALKRFYDEAAFQQILEEVISFLKYHGITAIYCMAKVDPLAKTAWLINSSDNVILTDMKVEGNRVHRKLMVLKSRMTQADDRVYELCFVDGRLTVKVEEG
ncbi:MAG: hypothetical protein DRJ97_00030 [Thermoprotei archaeon]|nr:MAG: hypothetical protein DRJ97_00030 [Thermoprotei archaeon]